jgi:PDZ domain-containing protein
MTQRTLAGLLAVPLLVALWVVALLVPLPFVVYSPGYTIDVLGKVDGKEMIEVTGAPSFHDQDGQLRFTTVFVTQPDTHIGLIQAMGAWLDPDSAVYPYDTVYTPGETDATNRREGAQQMSSSQDTAVAVALTELGYEVETPVVAGVRNGSPSDGVLEEGDELLAVDGDPVGSIDEVVSAVADGPAGQPLDVRLLRDGDKQTVSVDREEVDGEQRIGIELGVSYDFPFAVDFNIDSEIGGPSAGLMLSLATYDVLTEGPLTDGAIVAGTGTLDPDGSVGPIGGIDQKIAAARDDGASLFLVPPENCGDAIDAPRGSMRLVRAETMPEALDAVETWTADHDADLPQCSDDEGSSGA